MESIILCLLQSHYDKPEVTCRHIPSRDRHAVVNCISLRLRDTDNTASRRKAPLSDDETLFRRALSIIDDMLDFTLLARWTLQCSLNED